MYSTDVVPRVNQKEATLINRLDESSGNVLGWEVTGKVTEEEVRTISEEFKAAIAEHGKVRVLIPMRRLPRMRLGARSLASEVSVIEPANARVLVFDSGERVL